MENVIQKFADFVNTVFYFVYTENRRLKEEHERRHALELAHVMEISLFVIRSGPSVQDPQSLWDELKRIDSPLKFEIVCVDVGGSETTMLSYSDKLEFLNILENGENLDQNTGEIALDIMERLESEVEFIN